MFAISFDPHFIGKMLAPSAFALAAALRQDSKGTRYAICTRNMKRQRRAAVWCSNALEVAIHSGQILEVGRRVQLCPEGRLSSALLGAWRPSDTRWEGVVEEAITLLRALLRDTLVAVYVRGSVAAGHAFMDGRSDLDLVVLVRPANKKIASRIMHSARCACICPKPLECSAPPIPVCIYSRRFHFETEFRRARRASGKCAVSSPCVLRLRIRN